MCSNQQAKHVEGMLLTFSMSCSSLSYSKSQIFHLYRCPSSSVTSVLIYGRVYTLRKGQFQLLRKDSASLLPCLRFYTVRWRGFNKVVSKTESIQRKSEAELL